MGKIREFTSKRLLMLSAEISNEILSYIYRHFYTIILKYVIKI